jgi:outer membrane protein TolC
MRTNSIYIILLLLTFLSVVGVSQDIEMSLSEIKENVLKNNLDLKLIDADYAIREADYLQSRAMYYPNISLDYTGISTSSPLMAFGSKLNQSIVTQNDFNPALLNDPDAIQNFSFQLKVQQPIINFDKKHQRNAAKFGMEATLFQKERSREYLEFTSAQLYMQLQFAYEAISVLEQALETAQSNQKHAQNSFEVGYLQKADLLEIDVRINELKNKIIAAKDQTKNISDQLHTLMQNTSYPLIVPSENLQLSEALIPGKINENRSDYMAMDKANMALSEIVKSEKKTILPRLNAFGVFETNDDSPVSMDASNYLIGAQISWNLFDGMQRSAKVQRAKAKLHKGQIEKQKYVAENKAAFQKALRMKDQARIKLNTVKLAVEQAEESLRIRSNRFEQGLEKASDVLMSEASYSEKKLQELEIILEINIANLYAQFLSGEQ